MGRGEGEIVDQLIEYWRGNPPRDGAARYRCKLLEERFVRLLPPTQARAIQAAPERYREEIARLVVDLAESDPRWDER